MLFTLLAAALSSVWISIFGDFVVPSILMGVGIAIDVAIATITQYRNTTLTFWNWTFRLVCTHIILPAFGYYGFYLMGRWFHSLSAFLSILGFVIGALFLYQVGWEARGKTPVFSITASFARLIGLKEDDSRLWIKILSVSWDALWSGPAKAAQATAGAWTSAQVFWSFPIAGLTVGIIAHRSLKIAMHLRSIKFRSTNQLATSIRWGKCTELSVIGGFVLLSLTQVIAPWIHLYGAILLSSIFWVAFWLFFSEEIKQKSLEEAQEAIEPDTDGLDSVEAA